MNDDEKTCPFCAETIKAAAVVCKHCGRDLAGPTLPADADPTLMAQHGITYTEDRYVWRGNTFKRLEDAASYARVNAEQPRYVAAAPPQQSSFKWWLWLPVGLVVAFFAIGIASGPKTYADMAETRAQECIRSKGDGRWRASLGVSLEQFCKTVAGVEARQQMCKAYPERC